MTGVPIEKLQHDPHSWHWLDNRKPWARMPSFNLLLERLSIHFDVLKFERWTTKFSRN
jgi:hypothetical protein